MRWALCWSLRSVMCPQTSWFIFSFVHFEAWWKWWGPHWVEDGFSLQVSKRCSLGWSPTRPLPGRFCHCVWLLIQLPEQDTAGDVSGSDCQRFGLYVWNFVQERMGVPVPPQPSAHQLHGLTHREPRSDEPRWVSDSNTARAPWWKHECLSDSS